jgi:transposase
MDTYMSVRDARRLGVLEAARRGQITNREGARALGVSLRQFLRLKARLREEGPRALVHGNRGRASPRQLPDSIRERVVDLLQHPEVRLNDCHLADLLADEGIAVSPETVRRIRRALGLPSKHRRRPSPHRRRREPAAREGELVLVDGSPFHWLGTEQPSLSLLGSLDDATGKILTLCFRPAEDMHGYAQLLSQLFSTYGLPRVIYGDRTTVFVRNDSHWTLEEELEGRQRPPQLRQGLEELGVGYIPASSAQAKGRIERLWRTVQDRLVAELRLKDYRTVEQAVSYLPTFMQRFNQRFAHPARLKQSAWRRPPRHVERSLCCRYTRKVTRDNVVTVPGCTIHIPAGPHNRSWHRCRVEIRELLDGRLLVLYQGRVIAEEPPPPGEFILRNRHGHDWKPRTTRPSTEPSPAQEPPDERSRPSRKATTSHEKRPYRPKADHPWKRRIIPPDTPNP